VVGGAETLCRLLATNLAANGTDVTVLSTCANDHFTWKNVLPAGTSEQDGVTVRRFEVGPRDSKRFVALHTGIALGGVLPYSDQLEWMAESVWAPSMLDAVADARAYDWIIPLPYLFGTSFWATTVRPERTALIPCLHDEPHARTDVVLDCLAGARGLMANTATERELMARLLADHRGGMSLNAREAPVVSVGYHDVPPPEPAAIQAFCSRHGVEEGYLLYAGRRETGKGVGELFDVYRHYLARAEAPRRLALVGTGSLATPDDLSPYVVDLGFLPDHEMATAFAAAAVLVHPSRLESLGMILLEAWLAGTPAVVNGHSPVLVEHCRHGGGLWWHSPEEFCEAIELITDDPQVADRLAAAGRAYVLDTFSWPAVRGRFLTTLEQWS
jgi:glycosyltransferase involved in cell wall biosynthesis